MLLSVHNEYYAYIHTIWGTFCYQNQYTIAQAMVLALVWYWLPITDILNGIERCVGLCRANGDFLANENITQKSIFAQ